MLGAVVLAAAAVGSAPAAGAATTPATTPIPNAASPTRANTVRRVLVISLPGTSWADIQTDAPPNLTRLFAQSAVGDLITRTGGHSSIASGYTTLGAGGRASADTPLAGQAFEPGEPYGDSTAGDVFRQRTGLGVGRGLVHVGVEAIKQENAAGQFDPTVGSLGDTLARGHVTRSVIANGDGAQPIVDDPLAQYQRSAVNALMGNDGTVPGGAVGDELLMRDPRAPFGVRFDNDAVYRAFQDAWQGGGVVLVEGSDLLRVDQYSGFLSASQLAAQKAAALRRTDALVGRMLADVDPAHDAVVVVSPAPPAHGSGLMVAALRAPGVAPGLLRSATSRRTGFASVVDIAPTVLQLLGLRVPAKMEGQAMEVVGAGAGTNRVDSLVRANEDGVFRDAKVLSATNVLVLLSLALALAGALAVWRATRGATRNSAREVAPGRARGTRLPRWLSLAVLGYLLATYLASPLHFGRSGSATSYYAFLAVVAAVFATVCSLVGARRHYLPLALALAATVALHVGDLVSGTHFELNSVFGYSATVGIRVSGQGNLTFSIVSASVVLLGGLAVWRAPGRRTVYLVIAMLGVTLLVMAAPPFGGDFGGALAGAPSFALFSWLLLGRRVRVRTVAILGGLLVASGLAVGFIDLLRPKDQQTHIGRFFDQVANNGLNSFALTIRRKLDENLATFKSTRFLWILAIVAVLVVYLWRSPEGGIRTLFLGTAVVRQTMLALAVVALLGYGLNDSGIAIPAFMAVVFECAMVYVAMVALDTQPGRRQPPDPPVVAAPLPAVPVVTAAVPATS